MIDGQPTPRLIHEQILAPTRQVVKILSPTEIPVHPSVYSSDQVFQFSFLRRVHEATPEAIIRDMDAINRVLGSSINMEVTSQQLGTGETAIELDDINIYPSSKKRYFSVHYFSTSMSLGDLEGYAPKILRPYGGHPMPKEKLVAYAIDPTMDVNNPDFTLHCWDTNNYQDNGLPLMLYLRNFAITFNNMALDEIGL